MTLIPSYRSVLGIAKEATEGTAVPPTAFIRATDLKPAVKQTYWADTGMRGSMAKTYGMISGTVNTEYEVDGNLHLDTVGWYLAGLLGDVATTGVADPFTSTFSTLNSAQGQPGTVTLTDYNGTVARAFAGCRFSDLSFKMGAGGLVTTTAKLLGRTFATTTAPVPSFPVYPAQPSWRATVSIAGVSTAVVTEADIDIKRVVQAVHGLTATPGPSAIYADADLEVTGSLTVVYDSADGETVYGRFLSGVQVPVVIDLMESASRRLTLTMTAVTFIDGTVNRGTGKYTELALKFEANANTTDVGTSAGYSPIKATLLNGSAAGVYA